MLRVSCERPGACVKRRLQRWFLETSGRVQLPCDDVARMCCFLKIAGQHSLPDGFMFREPPPTTDIDPLRLIYSKI